MQWDEVQSVLNSLPATYRRPGRDYVAWQTSVTAALTRMTVAVDAIAGQTTFTGALGKWLDVWGLLLGVARTGIADPLYLGIITGTLLAGRGTLVGITNYLGVLYGIPATAIDDLPNVGWSLALTPGSTLTPAQIAQLPTWLAYIRPAGIPYVVQATLSPGFMSTGNFFGAVNFPNSWFTSGSSIFPIRNQNATNNNSPQIPTDWLTDPTLNN